MNYLLYTALFGLMFSQMWMLSVISICGHVLTRHVAFSRAIMFTLFTIVYNTYLKSIWQLPLPEPMQGWGLPSGHSHTMLIFWGWLAIESRSWFLGFLVAVIALLQGYGLLYQGYHYPIDIGAAWGFAAISLLIFWFLHKRVNWIANRPELFGLLLSGLCLLFIAIMPENAQEKKHVWQAHGALIGWIMGLMMCHSLKKPIALHDKLFEKIASLGFLFSVLGFLFFLMDRPQTHLSFKSYEFIRNFMLAFIAASWPMWVQTVKKYFPTRK